MIIVNLVGMYYRPPAIVALSCLATKSKLILIREPENEIDSNAIQVWCNTSDISDSPVFESYGSSLEEIQKNLTFMLGYIAAKETHLVPEDCSIGTLTFNVNGKPMVELH